MTAIAVKNSGRLAFNLKSMVVDTEGEEPERLARFDLGQEEVEIIRNMAEVAGAHAIGYGLQEDAEIFEWLTAHTDEIAQRLARPFGGEGLL